MLAMAIVMAINLYEHQKSAIEKLRSGSILCGGVGSGKSITALFYYFVKECNGEIDTNGDGGYCQMKKPKNLYIITTARKRDTLEWEHELCHFFLSVNSEESIGGVKVVVDSWNNINKFSNIKNSFFIFDEQRVVGSGSWVKAFLKITKLNNWILLSATPGDTWSDYIPVLIANGYYKNITEFRRRHIVYNIFTKYPKIDRYIETSRLMKLRNEVLVTMQFKRQTISHHKEVIVEYDKELFDIAKLKRWNVYENKPIKDIGELCYLMRKIVNIDHRRLDMISNIIQEHTKVIIFYNFNYELELLLKLGESLNIPTAQWNGRAHELIPKTDEWIYLVQYAAGAEGWNCIETDTIIFYSQNYSYKAVTQAAGRIDRLNTPFTDLYYYHLRSTSTIDKAINKALKNKKDFNQNGLNHFLNK